MKKRVRLTEGDLHRIVKESVNRILKENVEYEHLYDKIQDVTNDINKFCRFAKMNNSASDEYTKQLMDKLSDLSSQLSDTAFQFFIFRLTRDK